VLGRSALLIVMHLLQTSTQVLRAQVDRETAGAGQSLSVDFEQVLDEDPPVGKNDVAHHKSVFVQQIPCRHRDLLYALSKAK